MDFHTQFSERVRVQFDNVGPDMTKQSFKDETDINTIIAQYDRTGLLVHLNKAEAQFVDVSEVGDYQDALDVVKASQDAFMQLSAATRKIFGNSAAAFLDAAHDPDKRDLLEAAGLLIKEPPPVPIDVNIIPPVEDSPPADPE